MLPVVYVFNDVRTELGSQAKEIFNYKPLSSLDTTVVGDSTDTTKGNLVASTGSYTGAFKGITTYTITPKPAK